VSIENRTESQRGLRRGITWIGIFSFSFGSIIGVGWITVLGVWIQTAGPGGAILAFFLGFLVVWVVSLAYAELGAMFPVTGGEVAYSQMVFGSPTAFIVAWALLFAYGGAISFEMLSVGWVMTTIWPSLRGQAIYAVKGEAVFFGELLIGLLAAALIAIANIRGARQLALLQTVLTNTLIVIGIVFALLGAVKGNPDNLLPLIARRSGGSSMDGIYIVFAMSLFLYAGFNIAPQTLGERTSDVRLSSLSKIMALSVFGALFFYCTIILSASMLVPRDELIGSELPAAEAFHKAFNSLALRNLVLVAGVIGLLTTWNALVYAVSRILFVLAQLRLIPKGAGELHAVYGTPWVAVILATVTGVLGGLLGKVAILPIVTFGGTCFAIAWFFVSLAALRLRIVHPEATRAIRIPFGLALFPAATLASTFAFYTAVREAASGSDEILRSALYFFGGWFVFGFLMWLSCKKIRRTISETRRRDIIFLGFTDSGNDDTPKA
jgi:amino acid transporter